MHDDLGIASTESGPVGDLPREHLAYLRDAQGANGVVGMHDDRDAVQADHVLHGRRREVTKPGLDRALTLAGLDPARGHADIGLAVEQRRKCGAGPVRMQLHFHSTAIGMGCTQAQFQLARGLHTHFAETLLPCEFDHQCRRKIRTDSVGSVHAKHDIAGAGRARCKQQQKADGQWVHGCSAATDSAAEYCTPSMTSGLRAVAIWAFAAQPRAIGRAESAIHPLQDGA